MAGVLLIVPVDVFASAATGAGDVVPWWLSGFVRVSAVNLNVLAQINQGCR